MINPAINNFKISPLSDRSVLVSFGNIIDEEVNEKVLLLHKALLKSGFAGFVESVPAYASLAIFYDLPRVRIHSQGTGFDFVKKYVQQLLLTGNLLTDPVPGIIKIPVCYDAEYGIDIEQVANHHQLSINEVISLHSSPVYRVYMIGFLPGFAYMGTIVEKLMTPRKDQPRLNVPAGSVGIAGLQTGIYSIDSPGGWQIIGKTPLQIFNKDNLSPSLLSAGDHIQFVPIDKSTFKKSSGY